MRRSNLGSGTAQRWEIAAELKQMCAVVLVFPFALASRACPVIKTYQDVASRAKGFRLQNIVESYCESACYFIGFTSLIGRYHAYQHFYMPLAVSLLYWSIQFQDILCLFTWRSEKVRGTGPMLVSSHWIRLQAGLSSIPQLIWTSLVYYVTLQRSKYKEMQAAEVYLWRKHEHWFT